MQSLQYRDWGSTRTASVIWAPAVWMGWERRANVTLCDSYFLWCWLLIHVRSICLYTVSIALCSSIICIARPLPFSTPVLFWWSVPWHFCVCVQKVPQTVILISTKILHSACRVRCQQIFSRHLLLMYLRQCCVVASITFPPSPPPPPPLMYWRYCFVVVGVTFTSLWYT